MNLNCLTESQLFAYFNEGYVVIPDLIDITLVNELLTETDPERIRQHCPKGVFVSLQAQETKKSKPTVQQILNAELVGPVVQKLLFESRVKEIVTAILGPAVSLFEAKIIPKAPGVGAEVPMHQDFAYWLSTGGAPIQVNLLVYLQDANLENGCLQVVPRSHRQGLRAHQKGTDGSVFNFRVENGVSPVALPGSAGTGILFNSLILHGSDPNRSRHERRVITAVYTSASVGTRHKATVEKSDHDVTAFNPGAIPMVTGRGPHAGQSSKHYHSRELMKIAISHIKHIHGSWIETQNCCDSDWACEFLYARKPRDNRYLRISESSCNLTLDGVVSRTGKPCVVLQDPHLTQHAAAGLIFLTEATYSEVLLVLESLGSEIQPGTVVVFDKFFGQWWPSNAASALKQFISCTGQGVRLICRTDEALVVEFTSECSIELHSPLLWKPTVQGIEIATLSQVEEKSTSKADPIPQQNTIQAIKQKVKHSRFGPLARRSLGVIHKTQKFLGHPLRLARNHQWPNAFYPVEQIPRIVGSGPFYSRSPTHERRRALWHLALQKISDPLLPWCEFGVGDGESTDFFITHKPRENKLYAFDSFEGIPEPWSVYPAGQWKCLPYKSPRADVRVVKGYFDAVLADQKLIAELGHQIGLLHIDCDLFSSTKAVFNGLKSKIGAGTVIIFDEYYSFPNWPDHEIKAFYEWAKDHGIQFSYIARSDYQVALIITETSLKLKFDVLTVSGNSPINGTHITFER
jgi:ectoine hydroxylase-related dioxygenase (phytanoyl-CoA dioxygenase family)